MEPGNESFCQPYLNLTSLFVYFGNTAYNNDMFGNQFKSTSTQNPPSLVIYRVST